MNYYCRKKGGSPQNCAMGNTNCGEPRDNTTNTTIININSKNKKSSHKIRYV